MQNYCRKIVITMFVLFTLFLSGFAFAAEIIKDPNTVVYLTDFYELGGISTTDIVRWDSKSEIYFHNNNKSFLIENGSITKEDNIEVPIVGINIRAIARSKEDEIYIFAVETPYGLQTNTPSKIIIRKYSKNKILEWEKTVGTQYANAIFNIAWDDTKENLYFYYTSETTGKTPVVDYITMTITDDTVYVYRLGKVSSDGTITDVINNIFLGGCYNASYSSMKYDNGYFCFINNSYGDNNSIKIQVYSKDGTKQYEKVFSETACAVLSAHSPNYPKYHGATATIDSGLLNVVIVGNINNSNNIIARYNLASGAEILKKEVDSTTIGYPRLKNSRMFSIQDGKIKIWDISSSAFIKEYVLPKNAGFFSFAELTESGCVYLQRERDSNGINTFHLMKLDFSLPYVLLTFSGNNKYEESVVSPDKITQTQETLQFEVKYKNFRNVPPLTNQPKVNIYADDTHIFGSPFSMVVSTDSTDYASGIVYTASIPIEFESGKKYTYSLEVNDGYSLFESSKYSISYYIQGNKTFNYPNPFNPKRETTNILFNAIKNETVKIKIYSLNSKLIFEDSFNAVTGANEYVYKGKDNNGKELYNGVYLCLIEKSGGNTKCKIAVVK